MICTLVISMTIMDPQTLWRKIEDVLYNVSLEAMYTYVYNGTFGIKPACCLNLSVYNFLYLEGTEVIPSLNLTCFCPNNFRKSLEDISSNSVYRLSLPDLSSLKELPTHIAHTLTGSIFRARWLKSGRPALNARWLLIGWANTGTWSEWRQWTRDNVI